MIELSVYYVSIALYIWISMYICILFGYSSVGEDEGSGVGVSGAWPS